MKFLVVVTPPSIYHNGCGKKFSIEHALSFPNVGLVIAWHDDSTKELGDFGSRALVPSAITYEPKINSRTVQGKSVGDGVRQEGGESDSGTETVEESQGGRGRTVNRADRLLGQRDR